MFSRLKKTLVETYIGAIALGYLLAEVIMHFVRIFIWPVYDWTIRGEFGAWARYGAALKGHAFQDALPQFIWFLALLLLWYVLFRWLYFTPVKQEPSQPLPDSESAA